jgi:mono/diheme cytochrome c family protein
MRRVQPVMVCAILLTACAPARHQAGRSVVPADPGKARFDSYCAACHLSGGAGGIGEAPPLDGASWVTGPEHRLIRIVLHGLHGPIEIGGRSYNQEMPAFGQVLSDADAALLVSYVRRRFGGINARVPADTVARVRAASAGRTGYWSVEELMDAP